jgi:hypothetical protein
VDVLGVRARILAFTDRIARVPARMDASAADGPKVVPAPVNVRRTPLPCCRSAGEGGHRR